MWDRIRRYAGTLSAGRSSNLWLGLLGIAIVFAIWELSVRSGAVQATLVPLPSSLPGTFLQEIERGVWPRVVLGSLRHYTTGLLLGTVLGLAVGAAVALAPGFRALQYYVARVLRPIPPLAWIPFAIIWFGINRSAATFIISIGVFWINYFAGSQAIASVDRDLIEVARVFGHDRFFPRLMKVILPAALPGILTGMRTGIGQAWMTVVAAELFGIRGIGQRMIEASGLLAIDVVMVYMLTIAALYGLTDAAFSLLQRRLLKWQNV